MPIANTRALFHAVTPETISTATRAIRNWRRTSVRMLRQLSASTRACQSSSNVRVSGSRSSQAIAFGVFGIRALPLDAVLAEFATASADLAAVGAGHRPFMYHERPLRGGFLRVSGIANSPPFLVLNRHRLRIHSLLPSDAFESREHAQIVILVALRGEFSFGVAYEDATRNPFQTHRASVAAPRAQP